MKNVLIADDHEIIRYTIKIILKKILPEVQVDEANDLTIASRLIDKNDYQLIIFDLNFTGENNSFIYEFLKQKPDDTCILIFSASSEKNHALRCLKAGANGFLSKEASHREIEKALAEIIKNKRYYSKLVQEILIFDSLNQQDTKIDNSSLSPKEFEVATLLVNGKTNKEISDTLFLHPSTVSTYKSRIFSKLHVSNIVELSEYFH